MLIALRTAADHVRRPARSREVTGLSEAYFRPWLEAGHAQAAVDRALELALRIAPLARALAWGRVFPCFTGHPRPAGHAARVLAAFLDADPLAPAG